MNLNFVSIQRSDLPKVLAFFKAAAEKIAKKNIDHWQYWKNPPIEKIKWVEAGLRNNEFFFIKNDAQQTMGMVRILNEDDLYWGKQTELAIYIHSLIVIEPYQGIGLGQQIIEQISQNAKNKGVRFLRLDADAKNPKLCQYYQTQGFKKVGTKIATLSSYTLFEKEII